MVHDSNCFRSFSLSTLRSGGRMFTMARPWLKGGKEPNRETPSSKPLSASTSLLEESSEEDDSSLSKLQGLLRGHDRRQRTLQRLEADREMFTQGKVSALKAKFNLRRRGRSSNGGGERSDGVTDDDDDQVVY